jgi:hypothetical protein
VRVAQVVRANGGYLGGREGGSPDLIAEPVARDVAVGVPYTRCARVIHPGHPALTAVLGEGVLAVLAPATSGRIGAERPVPIGAVCSVGLGAAEPVWVGKDIKHWSALGHGEHQVVVG